MKINFNHDFLPTFHFELDETKTIVKIEKTKSLEGSIESVLGVSETDLKSLVEKRVREYIDMEYNSAAVLTDNCREVIPTLLRDPTREDSKYNSLRSWNNSMEEGFLPISYESIARTTIHSLKTECERGISFERKLQLEYCLEILTGPIKCS